MPRAVGLSSNISNSAILDRSASVSISCCETWFASHVCSNAYTCASTYGSSRYFEYKYVMMFSSKCCVGGGGVGMRSSVFSACRSRGGVDMRSFVFSVCRSGGGVLSLDCWSGIMGNVVVGSGVGVCSELSSSESSRVS